MERHVVIDWRGVPKEVWKVIFRNLEVQMWHRVFLVCQYFWVVGKEMLFQCTRLSLYTSRNNATDTILSHLWPSLNKIKLLDLAGCKAITDAALKGITQNCKSLRIISLYQCRNITNDGLIELLNAVSLKSLNLQCCRNISDKAGLVIAQHTDLVLLNLRGCSLLTDQSIVKISESCTKMKQLCLWGLENITNQSVLSLTEHLKDSLTELSLAECVKIDDMGLVGIKHCTRLRMLDLAQIKGITTNSITELDLLPSLEILDLKSANVLPAFINKVLTSSFTLRILNLSQCLKINDSTLTTIGKNLFNMEKLALNGCKRISDAGILHIAYGCPKLIEIQLSGDINLTDNSLVPLVQNCTNLRLVNLTQCALITDATVIQMAKLKKLKTVNFSQCKKITPAIIEWFKQQYVRPIVVKLN
eukprot:TRINITY_DN21706_c0_g1_i1.p1 TRINITY_DN21706_c0_g1~~TRINITY_DN21706_c0_g1_i1.p1  ORF type:complete len:417 (-),score=67.97 TRINITY_DN21706_c0_g1_i1:14-1264(-)